MGENENDTLPGLALVLVAVTPYHVHLQRLIAAGIPELKLHVLITHSDADFKWDIEMPPELHAKRFGLKGEHPAENPLRRPVWGWRKGGQLVRHLRQNNVQAAIVFGCYRFTSHLRVANYFYREGIPFFVNGDNSIRSERPLSRTQEFAKRGLYKWWMKRASGVMPMGALGDQFFVKYGADPKRLYRVPYWPDFDSFAQVDQSALDRFQRQFGLAPNRRRLIFSGRLVPQKRVDLLIDAFAKIAHDRPDWDLVIAGDGILNEELHRRVPESLRKRVVWTGFLDHTDPALAYHSADVLVLPSDSEQWALVVQEAMAAGLTVVASDVVGAAYELINDGVSGKIFSVGNGDSLRTALYDVTQPERIDEYRRQAALDLQRYREQVDPVAEIRRALTDVGVLEMTAACAR